MPVVRILGGASIQGEGDTFAGPAAQRHRIALVSLLALAHPRPTSRDRLLAYLWPERDTEHARNLLKQGVHALRRALGEGSILSAGDELYLNAEVVACDVIAFEAAIKAADFESAVALYRGPLLDGFHLPHASDFEHRTGVERERLCRRFVDALEALAERASARHDWGAAVEWRRRVATELPYNGLVTVRLMEALDASGDRAGALQQARLHSQVLKEQFEAEPDEQVVALAEQLRTETARCTERGKIDSEPPARAAALKTGASCRASAPSYPIVGRDAESERLRHTWAETAGGRPRFALITGEAGIGKTRLAEEFLVWIDGKHVDVARTRCYPAEGQLAYAPVTDLLGSATVRQRLEALDPVWLAEVARLLPELRKYLPDQPAPKALAEQWQRQRLFTGLTRALLDAREAMMLVIDDLQWCDQDTLHWLHFLLRTETDARLLVIGTARTHELSEDHALYSFLHHLRRQNQLMEIELGTLGIDAASALASQVAGCELSAEAAAHLYRETEGHPLFLVESVRAYLLDPAQSGGEGAGLRISRGRSLPPQVQAVIRLRLAQLSPAARRLAGTAATIGRDFSFAVLSRACDPVDDKPLDSLDELWQRRIIREQSPGRFDFTHDKLREVAYSDLGPVRRTVLHRRVAEALLLVHASNLDAVSGQIAGHYDRAAMPDDALAFYQAAAIVATRLYANEEAIGHLRRALVLLATMPRTEERERRELELQIALLPPLRATRGWSTEELGVATVRARELCDRVGTVTERFRIMWETISFQVVRGNDFRAAHATAKEFLDLAQGMEDPCLLTPALHAVGITHCQRGEFALAAEYLERAVASYDRRFHGSHVLLFGADFGVFSRAWAAHALWHLGHADRAVALSSEALEMSSELAHPFSRAIALAYGAMLLQFMEEPERVAEQSAALSDLSRQQGYPYYEAWGKILQGWALAERCEERDVEHGMALIGAGIDGMKVMGAGVRRSYYLSLLADLCAKNGQRERGMELLGKALGLSKGSGEHWKDAELLRLQGVLSLAGGDDEREAENLFRQARAVARQQDARMLDLRAVVSLARLLQRQQRREEARAMLGEALAWLRQVADTRELKRAGALMAELS